MGDGVAVQSSVEVRDVCQITLADGVRWIFLSGPQVD